MKPNQSCILDYYSKKICLGNWLKADLILKIHAILLFHLYCISYMSVMTGDFFFSGQLISTSYKWYYIL